MASQVADDLNMLIAAAEEVLLPGLSPEEVLERLERYSERFETWFPAHEELLKSRDPALPADRVAILVARHEAVVALAGSQQNATSSDLRQMQKRGRGILAYTDVLPGSISVTRPRKG